jgi:predicted ATPase
MLEAIAVTYGFNPEVEILSFDNGEIYPCEYEETDSYQVTEMFINNREQILKRLLEG